MPALDRRDFLKSAGAGLTAATVMLTPREQALAQAEAEKNRLLRIAACSYPIRYIFKNRAGGGRGAGAGRGAGRGAGASGQPGPGPDRAGAPGAGAAAPGAAAAPSGTPTPQLPPRSPSNGGWTSQRMKEKYGEITMLDFPQFSKDTFPGVTNMDIFSGLFGDVTDDSMFVGRTFDPMSPSGRKWLDQLANKLVTTGTKVQHISNNAPTNLAGPDETLRKAGVEVAKRWLQGCAVLGVKSMRMNSPQALGPSIRPNAIPRSNDGYPRNLDIIPLLNAAIESYKEMADYGGNLGIRVTFENHWGLAADPMNIRIMLDTINHPYCEASPDFCNWEHEYMLFNGLKALAPYAHTNVHAKYWDRWGDKNDVQRSTRIMLAGGFKGTFALEYEEGPLNGIEGAKYLYKEVLAALTTPTPVV
ncbi:MAG TPA: TIM barrel protein [Thermomicrobiales bacterium]|nr:TIM barrel protein [Thermomicrobiales bacterium]